MKNIAAILLASIAITGCKGLMGPAVEVIECDGSQTDCINNWFDEKFTEMLDFLAQFCRPVLGLRLITIS